MGKDKQNPHEEDNMEGELPSDEEYANSTPRLFLGGCPECLKRPIVDQYGDPGPSVRYNDRPPSPAICISPNLSLMDVSVGSPSLSTSSIDSYLSSRFSSDLDSEEEGSPKNPHTSILRCNNRPLSPAINMTSNSSSIDVTIGSSSTNSSPVSSPLPCQFSPDLDSKEEDKAE